MPFSSRNPDVVIFMSADVVGSTAFKAAARDASGHALWLEAFETLFRELPLIFIGQMATAFFDQDDLPESGVWKVMGDEVVFVALPRTLEDAQRIVAAFHRTVVSYDRRLAARWPLRIRGCCWAADLVERNRMIEIPEMFGGTDGRYRDFLGPDIDTGFRLSAHSGAGELIVSPNLVEAFAQQPDQAGLRFHYLGRKPMKGVCAGQPYPLVMVSVAPDPAEPPLAAEREIVSADVLHRELHAIRTAMLQEHDAEMAAPVFAAARPNMYSRRDPRTADDCMPHSESFVIRNRRAEVSAFADRFEAFCAAHGIAGKEVNAFQVALDEVLANIVDYAHPDGGEHPIEIRLTLVDDRMDAEVIDDGLAFDPLENSTAPDLDADLASRPVGGLGVHLIRNLMDSVAYRRVGAHNHLLMSKRLPRS